MSGCNTTDKIKDGKDGKDCSTPGCHAQDGKDGKDGEDGVDGKDGKDGKVDLESLREMALTLIDGMSQTLKQEILNELRLELDSDIAELDGKIENIGGKTLWLEVLSGGQPVGDPSKTGRLDAEGQRILRLDVESVSVSPSP